MHHSTQILCNCTQTFQHKTEFQIHIHVSKHKFCDSLLFIFSFSKYNVYIYCHYKSVFLSDNVRCIILFLLFIDRNVLLKLKSVSDMRKAFVIVHAYALFLWHSLTRTYSVSGKVHRNWGIIGMWAVWPSALIVYVGNLSTFLIKSK